MNIEFYNCPKYIDLDTSILPKNVGFLSYIPKFNELSEFAKVYSHYKNILIIGHGGSITSFYGIYNSLAERVKNNVYFLNTIDPDYISKLKKLLRPEETLVITISKSGENITQFEMFSQFLEYESLVITGKSSPLRAMAEKLKLKIILHPEIGGRFTGFTEVSLIPAIICGLNIEELYKGAQKVYNLYAKNNLAWHCASVLYQLEQQGIVDVFLPFYSNSLYYFSNIIVQLCHESFGKNGIGQTYFAHEGPESQHHTNQRFFGGRKNICGFFVSQEEYKNILISNYPPSTHSVHLKGHQIFDINKIPLADSMKAEISGTLEDARINNIPIINLTVAKVTEENIGEFLAFWQLFALYSSLLRKVDPFDQPQVENSKNISFTKRLALKGFL